jgi:hypothetical protein
MLLLLSFNGYFPYGGQWADQLVFDSTTLSPDCPDTKICVEVGTTWLDVMRGRLYIPEENIVTSPSSPFSLEMFESGECNAMAIDCSYLQTRRMGSRCIMGDDNTAKNLLHWPHSRATLQTF